MQKLRFLEDSATVESLPGQTLTFVEEIIRIVPWPE